MRVILFGVSILLIFVFSNCNDQPTSFSDSQDMNSALSKPVGSEYIPGTDITDELRTDLNTGLDVNLPAGQYYVSESIIVIGYSGTVKGAGKDVTIIEAAQGFKAMEDPFFPGFKVSEIFSVYWSKGDVTFKDMTFLVTGDAPAEVHNNPFVGEVTTIDNVIVVSQANSEVESGITAMFKNLKIKGEDSTDPLSYNGKNMVYPLIATGWGGDNPVNAIFKDCEIENAGSAAIEFFAAIGGFAEIRDNEISDSYMGLWIGWGLAGSEATIKNNRFNNISTNAIFKYWPVGSYCAKNNKLDGLPMTDDCQ